MNWSTSLELHAAGDLSLTVRTIPPVFHYSLEKYFDRMCVTLPALKSFIECPSTTPFRISCPIQDFLSEFVFGCKLHQKLHLTLWFVLTCAVPDMTGI